MLKQDHRAIKKRIRAKSIFVSWVVCVRDSRLRGDPQESRKGQLRWVKKGDVLAQNQFTMTDTGVREQIDSVDRGSSNPAGRPKASLRRWIIPLILGGIVAAVLIFGIRSRLKSQSALRTVTVQMAVPSVS